MAHSTQIHIHNGFCGSKEKEAKLEPFDTIGIYSHWVCGGQEEAMKENQSWEQVRQNTSMHVCEEIRRPKDLFMFKTIPNWLLSINK
jgi:hypothetical protein